MRARLLAHAHMLAHLPQESIGGSGGGRASSSGHATESAAPELASTRPGSGAAAGGGAPGSSVPAVPELPDAEASATAVATTTAIVAADAAAGGETGAVEASVSALASDRPGPGEAAVWAAAGAPEAAVAGAGHAISGWERLLSRVKSLRLLRCARG